MKKSFCIFIAILCGSTIKSFNSKVASKDNVNMNTELCVLLTPTLYKLCFRELSAHETLLCIVRFPITVENLVAGCHNDADLH